MEDVGAEQTLQQRAYTCEAMPDPHLHWLKTPHLQWRT